MTDYVITRESCTNGIVDLVVHHKPTGVMLKGCGADRDEVFSRVKAEIDSIVAALSWPDECNADTINGFDDSEVTWI
jgi:hypothetical protein